jgi:hypothetical protein
MNHKRKLIELAAKADGTVKELGLLPTKNRPDYDEAGNFNGMRESVDGKKTVAGAVGTLGVAGGAVAANSAIQGSFGGQGVESWKQAGRYGVNEAKSAVSGAYANNPTVRTGRAFVKRKGRGLIAGLGKIAARLKGFDSKVALKELAAKSVEFAEVTSVRGRKVYSDYSHKGRPALRPLVGNTLTDGSAIYTLDGEKIVHGNGLSASRFNEDGSSAIPGKPSTAELKSRFKIGVGTGAVAGGLGFIAGKALRKAA